MVVEWGDGEAGCRGAAARHLPRRALPGVGVSPCVRPRGSGHGRRGRDEAGGAPVVDFVERRKRFGLCFCAVRTERVDSWSPN